ncbi:hypothetical protein [Kitasatospora sp. NPDC051914]|uniref:hypothetical protein n=1 Tax=unclassified Kitasatospora TaxID=2633591 RepID=UPI0034328CC2
MSFGWHARRVADSRLPLRVRVAALRSCVQLYRPLGFHGTLDRLAWLAGPFQRDEAALLRALAVLEEDRGRWLAELDDYARSRRTGKRCGRRVPGEGERNPNDRSYWSV